MGELEFGTYVPMHPRDYLILFSLVDGAMHGYGMVKCVEEESNGTVRMDPANLYRSLRRLERDGLVSEVEDGEAGDGEASERRRYYALTDEGRRAVAVEAARLARLAHSAVAKRLITRKEVT